MKITTLILAAAFAALALVGCGPSVPPATLVVAVDETGSSKVTRGTGIELSQIAAANLLGIRDSIHASVLTFGQSVQPLGGPVRTAKDKEEISSQGQIPALFNGIANISVPNARGGTIAPLFEELANRCKGTNDQVYCLINTDGEIYDVKSPQGLKRLDAAITELGTYGNLRKVLIGPVVINGGANENWRGVLDKHLEPLGDKVFLFSASEVNQAKQVLQGL